MHKILTPISHLFQDISVAEEIVTLSDGLECRDHSINFREDMHLALHCELQPIHPLTQKDFDYLRGIKASKPHLELVSFHVATCYDRPVIENGKFQPGGNRFSRMEMIENAKNNFEKIREIFGDDVFLAVENNNYYQTEAYQHVTDPDFLYEIVYENNIHFLFDIAHAGVSSHNKGVSYQEYVTTLPMDKVIQLHICRHGIKENEAYDAHFPPGNQEWEEIKRLIQKYTIKYFTVEYYRDRENLFASLKHLRTII